MPTQWTASAGVTTAWATEFDPGVAFLDGGTATVSQAPAVDGGTATATQTAVLSGGFVLMPF